MSRAGSRGLGPWTSNQLVAPGGTEGHLECLELEVSRKTGVVFWGTGLGTEASLGQGVGADGVCQSLHLLRLRNSCIAFAVRFLED